MSENKQENILEPISSVSQVSEKSSQVFLENNGETYMSLLEGTNATMIGYVALSIVYKNYFEIIQEPFEQSLTKEIRFVKESLKGDLKIGERAKLKTIKNMLENFLLDMKKMKAIQANLGVYFESIKKRNKDLSILMESIADNIMETIDVVSDSTPGYIIFDRLKHDAHYHIGNMQKKQRLQKDVDSFTEELKVLIEKYK